MGMELRRRFIQLAFLCLTNQEVGNLFRGKIYKGEGKYLCAPGLNCYSCPAATLSCPIGALQTLGGSGYGPGFYVPGFLLVLGVLLGRMVCGFLCPFGFFQELLHKLPLPKKALYPPLRYIKYLMLLFLVLALPIYQNSSFGIGEPAFCQYICPAGTLEGAVPLLFTHPEFYQALGGLFALKMAILLGVLLGCAVNHRFFCKTLCPLGAIYGLMNPISIYRMRMERARCLACGKCAAVCPMELNPVNQPNSPECIRCGRCSALCPGGSLTMGFGEGFTQRRRTM